MALSACEAQLHTSGTSLGEEKEGSREVERKKRQRTGKLRGREGEGLLTISKLLRSCT